MHLSPREIDKLLLHQAGGVAQRRLARGLRLNYPEAVALIAAQLLEFIREGKTVAQLMDLGRQFLGTRQVMPGIPDMISDVQVEGTFPDGTKLVTVHHPIVRTDGDLALALHGSFLPIPPLSAFGDNATTSEEPPGSVQTLPGDLELNAGRRSLTLSVTNTGDRPIQVGSHYHFAETNPALRFDRAAAYGTRLDIPAGTAVRFEPGDTKSVQLVDIAGNRVVLGGNNLMPGPVTPDRRARIADEAAARSFAHAPSPPSP